ncbi:MAG: DNA translocase FtsK 4TM domain-containing protein, partial [Pseudolabrys sp.]
MRATDRSLDVVAIVSEHFRDILRRRLSELAGLALITLGLLGAIALSTWSVQDPSLSHATQTPIHNLLGFPGAIFSDLAMQLLGLASILLLLPEALLGWRLLAHRPLGAKWRGLVWILATFFAAGLASTLPRVGSWPLPTGLGGVAGDALLYVPAMLFGQTLSTVMLVVMAIVFGAATIATLVVAVGWRRGEQAPAAEPEELDDADDDRGSAWKGMFVHALLSGKARIARMFRRTPARKAMPNSMMRPAAGGRHEPRFDGIARVAAPNMAPELAEDEFEEDVQAAPRRRAPAAPKPRRSGTGFVLPSLNLLTAQRVSERTTLSKDVIDANAVALESVLGDFGVRGEIINARPGPVVTLYELEPAPGIKSSRVIGLADDIARSMSALSARVAVVPGRNAIGIELPNPHREKV